LPPLISDFGKMIPEYKILKGWKQKTDEIEKFNDLPVNA
jgi:adenylosuccinate synthase